MAVGSTQFFRPSLGVQTLLFTRGERDQSVPTQMVVANTDAADPVLVTVEIYNRILDITRYISKGHEVPLGRTHSIDLTPFPLRLGDRLYVTIDVSADVFLFLDEPADDK